ncbi:MAG: M15 family metallopeptidase [Firmicutes bacterium]|nr:M15 family metallopeptidase [Bacillota bacterium]
MRRSRFPLLSILVVLLLAAAIGYRAYIDVDVPQRALEKVGAAISRLGLSLQLLSNSAAEGGMIFAPAPGTASDPMPPLVNGQNPVAEGFVPSDLVRMRDYCDKNVVTIKGSEIEGNRTAVDALMRMLSAAIAEGVTNWQISAGYRSVAYQQQLWDNRVYEYRQQGMSAANAQAAAAQYVAKAGYSEHHTGLAFDVTVPGESFPLTKQCKWLMEHCWDYGFVIRFTEEKQAITGIAAEPWHIRYVGQPHARLMRENNWCLEEYLASR